MTIEVLPLKIAFLQFYNNGDCMFATVVARQIKSDYPNSKLTWFISNSCQSIIENNSDVDEIVVINIKNKIIKELWLSVKGEIIDKLKMGEYDLFFSTQLLASETDFIGENEANYNGTVRNTIFKSYPHPITVDIKPIISLTHSEVQRVNDFVKNHSILNYKTVILFECAPVSGQIPINPVIAYEIAATCLKELNDTCFILTSGTRINSENNHIFDASVLSIRENAELINNCTHFIGCSSGITWLNTSNWCKEIPMLQLLDNTSFFFNSVCRDYKFNNLDSSTITEIKFTNFESLNIIITEFIKDHKTAKRKYHIEFEDHSRTIYTLSRIFISRWQFTFAFKVIRNTFAMNKTNWHYYYKIIKVSCLAPFFMFYGFIVKIITFFHKPFRFY